MFCSFDKSDTQNLHLGRRNVVCLQATASDAHSDSQQAEYIVSKEKQRLHQMLEQFRKQLQHSEVELEALRGALVRSESQTVKDRDEIQRLSRMIDQTTQQVRLLALFLRM